MTLIPRAQRAYLRSHPIAISFALAVLASGFVGLVFPETIQQDPSSLLLPDWLEQVFRWAYLVSGGAATYGLLRGKPNFEAAGWAVVTAVLASSVAALLFLSTDPSIVVGAIITAMLAGGTGLRALYLIVELPRHGDHALGALPMDDGTGEHDEVR